MSSQVNPTSETQSESETSVPAPNPPVPPKPVKTQFKELLQTMDLDAIRSFYDANKTELSASWMNHTDYTLMYFLCSNCRSKHPSLLPIVKFLIDVGNDKNQIQNVFAPLHFSFHDENVTAYLIEIGADVNQTGCGGYSPLFKAVELGNLRVVEMLLKAGAKAQHTNWDGISIIGNARQAKTDTPELLELLQRYGADINVVK
jgi:ankyrin repeat protein